MSVFFDSKRFITPISIIALHGMNGHAFNSWEYRDDSGYSFMWLRDYLPEHIPNARIVVYGYNANLVSDVSTGRIRTYAETFLERLLAFRKRNTVRSFYLILKTFYDKLRPGSRSSTDSDRTLAGRSHHQTGACAHLSAAFRITVTAFRRL